MKTLCFGEGIHKSYVKLYSIVHPLEKNVSILLFNNHVLFGEARLVFLFWKLYCLYFLCGKLSKMGSAISVRSIVCELWLGFMLLFIIANVAILAIYI